MENNFHGKTTKNLRNRISVKLVTDEKVYWKWTWKTSCISHKIFENNLVVMQKSTNKLTHPVECTY